MKLLLDTHVAVWWLDDSERLTTAARRAIEDALHSGAVFVSAVSGIEIAIGRQRGVPAGAVDAFAGDLEASGFRTVSFDMQDARSLAGLPRLHGDPFDRALAAQAQRRGLTLMTADASLAEYPIAVFRL